MPRSPRLLARPVAHRTRRRLRAFRRSECACVRANLLSDRCSDERALNPDRLMVYLTRYRICASFSRNIELLERVVGEHSMFLECAVKLFARSPNGRSRQRLKGSRVVTLRCRANIVRCSPQLPRNGYEGRAPTPQNSWSARG